VANRAIHKKEAPAIALNASKRACSRACWCSWQQCSCRSGRSRRVIKSNSAKQLPVNAVWCTSDSNGERVQCFTEGEGGGGDACRSDCQAIGMKNASVMQRPATLLSAKITWGPKVSERDTRCR